MKKSKSFNNKILQTNCLVEPDSPFSLKQLDPRHQKLSNTESQSLESHKQNETECNDTN